MKMLYWIIVGVSGLGCLFPVYAFLLMVGVASAVHPQAFIIPGLCLASSIAYLVWISRVASSSGPEFSWKIFLPLTNLALTPALIFGIYWALEKFNQR